MLDSFVLGAALMCKDPLVNTLHEAGFRGHDVRAAYAIVMRESKGENLDESSPWYSGALGIFQIQTSAHAGKPWWSRSAMLHPPTQARIAYKYLSQKGTYWQHWGVRETASGFVLDTTYYSGWSAWQHQNWIIGPFNQYWNAFPKKCRSVAR